MNLTNKNENENENENNNIVKLFISNIFEQDGGKKGGKKGKKGKKAKKKNKPGDAGEIPERERYERPERSESSSDVDSSPSGSSPSGSYPSGSSGGIHSQIITSDVVPSNLQVDIDNQRENNTRQDTELSQLREFLFQDQTDEIKLLKQNEEETRKNEVSKILNEIENLKKIVEENKMNISNSLSATSSDNLSATSSAEIPLEEPTTDPNLTAPNAVAPDGTGNIQTSVAKKYEIKYD